jgi:hypothetical protein
MHTEHHDGPAGSYEFTAASQAFLGSSRLDHNVVGLGGSAHRCTELFASLALMRVSRFEGDLRCPHPPRPGYRQQSERASSNDGDTRGGAGVGKSKRMP